MDETPTAQPRSRNLRLWLIVDTVLSILTIVPIAIFGMMSVMASDAGVNTAITTYIWISLSFPVAVAVAPILAWVAFALRRERTALIVSLLPALWMIAIIGMFIIGFGEPQPA